MKNEVYLVVKLVKQLNNFLIVTLIFAFLSLLIVSEVHATNFNDSHYNYPTLIKKNKDGYPIFDMDCNEHTDSCTDGIGTANNFRIIAENMPVIRLNDLTNGYKCNYICRDPDGQIVGSDPLTTHKKYLKNYNDYRFVRFKSTTK